MPNPSQMSIETYIRENRGTINIYKESAKTESKTDGAQVKLTATQKMALKGVCDMDGVGMSTWISDAIELKLQLRPYLKKFDQYKTVITSLLESLP